MQVKTRPEGGQKLAELDSSLRREGIMGASAVGVKCCAADNNPVRVPEFAGNGERVEK